MPGSRRHTLTRFAVAGLAALIAAATAHCGGSSTADDAALADGDAEHCDADALRATLAAAAPGAVVRVGACRVVGSFTVPAGVTLRGRGIGESTIEAAAPSPALRIAPGAPATRVSDLTVESRANSAVLVLPGGGTAALDRVRVAAARGLGIAAQDVGRIELTDVALDGPVAAENESGHPQDPAETAAYGLLLLRVRAAFLTGVTVRGFALFGALLIDSGVAWTGGGTPGNIGTGLAACRGQSILDHLDLDGALDGDRLMPAYGALFVGDETAEAIVSSTGLSVSGGADYGILHQHAAAVHRDLDVSGNGGPGVIAHFCSSLEIAGSSRLEGNRGAGLVVAGTPRFAVAGTEIASTADLSLVSSEGGTIVVGDGIHLLREPGGTVAVRDVVLRNNDRVGLLVDLQGGTMDGTILSGVSVAGTGTALGAAAQNGTIPARWDDGIARDPTTAANDAAPHPPLPILRIDPPSHPTGFDRIATGGIAVIIDPDPR
jgi:hypothetical protein